MIVEVVSRLLGAGGLGVGGWRLGVWVSTASSDQSAYLPWGLALTLAGVLIGALATPYVVFKPLATLLDRINRLPAASLVSATVGLLVGLVIAVLISIPLFNLAGWLSWGVPLIISFSLGLLGLWLGAHREGDMRRILLEDSADGYPLGSSNGSILVDTRAIIDGRIADLGLTGFIRGTLVVPAFVLDELRHIADSSDSLRAGQKAQGP